MEWLKSLFKKLKNKFFFRENFSLSETFSSNKDFASQFTDLSKTKFPPPPETSDDLQSILNNLTDMKKLILHKSKLSLDLQFNEIQKKLGIPECHETIRQDRWNPSTYCPFCRSKDVQRIEQNEQQESRHNYRYLCLNCHEEFDDDTKTPLKEGVPPLHVWIQCWYLWGITHSAAHIAQQLNLPLQIVEAMLKKLKSIFSSKEPLENLPLDNELSIRNRFTPSLQRQEDRKKQAEYLNADVTYQARDTNEQRRQKERRTDPKKPPGGR
ncbi:MAG: hypothetical protein ACKOAD_03285 [Gammaproteobacteria bacterium]